MDVRSSSRYSSSCDQSAVFRLLVSSIWAQYPSRQVSSRVLISSRIEDTSPCSPRNQKPLIAGTGKRLLHGVQSIQRLGSGSWPLTQSDCQGRIIYANLDH